MSFCPTCGRADRTRNHAHACRRRAERVVRASFNSTDCANASTIFTTRREPDEEAPAHKILDGLWLGNADAARNCEWVALNGIRTIVNCAIEIHLPVPSLNACGVQEVVNLNLIDCSEFLANMPSFARKITDGACAVVGALEAGPVLVNCAQGISRSVAVMAAALMLLQRPRCCTLLDALLLIKRVRGIARPNAALFACLIALEPDLRALGLQIDVQRGVGSSIVEHIAEWQRGRWSKFADATKTAESQGFQAVSNGDRGDLFPVVILAAHPDALTKVYWHGTGELRIGSSCVTWAAAAFAAGCIAAGRNGGDAADMALAFPGLCILDKVLTQWPCGARTSFLTEPPIVAETTSLVSISHHQSGSASNLTTDGRPTDSDGGFALRLPGSSTAVVLPPPGQADDAGPLSRTVSCGPLSDSLHSTLQEPVMRDPLTRCAALAQNNSELSSCFDTIRAVMPVVSSTNLQAMTARRVSESPRDFLSRYPHSFPASASGCSVTGTLHTLVRECCPYQPGGCVVQ